MQSTNIIRAVGDSTSRPATAGLASETPARLRVKERVQAISVTAGGLSDANWVRPTVTRAAPLAARVPAGCCAAGCFAYIGGGR